MWFSLLNGWESLMSGSADCRQSLEENIFTMTPAGLKKGSALPTDSPHCLSRKQQIKIHDGVKTKMFLWENHIFIILFLIHFTTASHGFESPRWFKFVTRHHLLIIQSTGKDTATQVWAGTNRTSKMLLNLFWTLQSVSNHLNNLDPGLC